VKCKSIGPVRAEPDAYNGLRDRPVVQALFREELADFEELLTTRGWVENVAPVRKETIEKSRLVVTLPMKIALSASEQ